MARARGPLRIEPLWVRVERNRLKLVVFMLLFLLAWAIAFAVVLWVPAAIVMAAVAAGGQANADPGWGLTLSRWVGENLGLSAALVGLLGAACSALYAAITLAQPVRKQLAALGVRAVYKELPETRHALRDMAIASGFAELQPELFVLESSSTNAFIIGRARQRAYVVITSHMAEHMPVDHQRAVFANLMARLRAGDVQWATAVSALMAPVWRWKDLSADRSIDARLAAFVAGDTAGPTYATRRAADTTAGEAAVEGSYAAVPFVGPILWLTYTAAVVASELVALGHRRSHLLTSQVADAEGMLLLKDATCMLGALREAIEADNRVRIAQPLYAQLFYIWAGDDLTDEEDPEWERLDRLQEIVGVDGIADAEQDMLRPAEDYADYSPPASPVAEAYAPRSYAPPPKEEVVEVSFWTLTIGALVASVIATMLVSAPLVNMGLGRPVGAPPEGWAAYAHRFASAELLAVIALPVIVFIAAGFPGRKTTGAVLGGVCALLLLALDILGRGLTTTVVLGMDSGMLFALVAGGALIAGIAGGAVGSLVKRA